MKVFIIIPCYNEEARIGKVLGDAERLQLDKKIIVVDDGSLDNSCKVVRDNFKDVLLLEHKINLGKGAALKTGCEAAIKMGGDTIVLIDGDGQHPPEVIPQMIEKIQKENLDIVFGSRKFDTKKMPLIFYFGNKFLTSVINFISGISLSDSQSGLRAFRSSAYPKLEWRAPDYSVETEMIVNVKENKLKYGEVFIDTIYNDNYKGTTPFDGIKILFNLIKKKTI